MKLEIYLFIVTAFLIYNTYYDGKYTNLLKVNMKYIKMAMYGFGALSLYMFFKKNPNGSKGLLLHTADLIKYMPIDKNTADVISPFLNFTQENTGNFNFNQQQQQQQYQQPDYRSFFVGGNNGDSNDNTDYSNTRQKQNRIHQNQPPQKNKRSVSETKKKYVASHQNWKCGHCKNQLDYSFEVDHIVDLQHGGTNDVSNLVALCRNCHGKKTLSNYL